MGWHSFRHGKWCDEIDVDEFIRLNRAPYMGDGQFLSSATAKTNQLWAICQKLLADERTHPVIDADMATSITAYTPGYIDKGLEEIIGLQTNEPLKRALMPNGGMRMVKAALSAYGKKLHPNVELTFKHRKSHNDAVFERYTANILLARKTGLITGLPDAYGRGRIIGDYRRVPLYGLAFLLAERRAQLSTIPFDGGVGQAWREVLSQVKALEDMGIMAQSYGVDISKPADTAKEAVQWLYFAYLAATKEQNGAAMSLGRVSTFLDIYIERDLARGILTEELAQELIDHLVIKLRMIRFLRTPDYDELFSGDPTWITEAIGGMASDGRPLVTKTSFRMLHTLRTLGPAPEPNLTVLWSERLPAAFKEFCAQITMETSAIQYENDDLMSPVFGDDYSIACCVSAMRTGKQMQFFGARANMAKALLYAINEGRDEISGVRVIPGIPPMLGEVLSYDEVMRNFGMVMDWMAKTYVEALNIIHHMHDLHHYERLQMALHDVNVERLLATGIAGLSVVADSLSAIRYATVRPVRNAHGIAESYMTTGEFPKFGNNEDEVDQIAVMLVRAFMGKLKRQPTYRNAKVTQSILTITSNVVYGKKTGDTPDGRRRGEPFAPGANPMHGRDSRGALASCASVAKLPYEAAMDGISYTFSASPAAMGKTEADRLVNLRSFLDGYFASGGQHINVNMMTKETLEEAMRHPEKYPQLTVRVSGYAVNFTRLTMEQQTEVIRRTFHMGR